MNAGQGIEGIRSACGIPVPSRYGRWWDLRDTTSVAFLLLFTAVVDARFMLPTGEVPGDSKADIIRSVINS